MESPSQPLRPRPSPLSTTILASPPSPSSPEQTALSQALNSTAKLANHLPTGTVLAFQLLTPIFSNNGVCDTATRHLTLLLLILLAASCFFTSFTDSVKAANGQVYHGVATLKGLWLFEYPYEDLSGLPDLRKFRIRAVDVVHAVLSVLVFVAVALRDKNVVSCFYPTPGTQEAEILGIIPVGIGILSSWMFIQYPSRRHGIGFPITKE